MRRAMDLFAKLRNRKILLIDDDEWIRDAMSLFFEDEGCDLIAFETAEEGIDAISTQRFDIMIVDYRLPGMDGLTFFERLNRTNQKSIKILITAYGDKEVSRKAKQVGVDDIIDKPFTTETIETVLLCLVEKGGL